GLLGCVPTRIGPKCCVLAVWIFGGEGGVIKPGAIIRLCENVAVRVHGPQVGIVAVGIGVGRIAGDVVVGLNRFIAAASDTIAFRVADAEGLAHCVGVGRIVDGIDVVVIVGIVAPGGHLGNLVVYPAHAVERDA